MYVCNIRQCLRVISLRSGLQGGSGEIILFNDNKVYESYAETQHGRERGMSRTHEGTWRSPSAFPAASLLCPHSRLALAAVPRPFGRLLQADAVQVEPLDLAVGRVAADHLHDREHESSVSGFFGVKVTRESRGDARDARKRQYDVPLRTMVVDRSNTASGPLLPPRLRTRPAPACCRRRPARVSACCPLAPPPPAPGGALAAPPATARSAAASRTAVERRLVPGRAQRCAAVAPAFAVAAAGTRRSSPSVAERQAEEYLVYRAMRRRRSGAGKGRRDGSRSRHRWEFQACRACRRSGSRPASRSALASSAQVREEQRRESYALQTCICVRYGSGERARKEKTHCPFRPEYRVARYQPWGKGCIHRAVPSFRRSRLALRTSLPARARQSSER